MPAEKTEDVELIPRNIEKVVKIKIGFGGLIRLRLIELLGTYADIFAWTTSDMSGID